MTELTSEQLRSVKKSYLNIIGFLLNEENIESRYLRCLLKWGFQLKMTPDDLRSANVDISYVQFLRPEEKAEKLEAIYHLVYMIYLDKVVEDAELEVATLYAQKLGFKASVVSDLFKSIATADDHENLSRNVRKEVIDFLQLQEEK